MTSILNILLRNAAPSSILTPFVALVLFCRSYIVCIHHCNCLSPSLGVFY
ncbi:unnamed protein product [Hymenolepis diminuta]|uniref:Uncharacterized protein n=1 Tax=Hymenolepis diminuta TaxID=6216 RepID=A0A564XWP6_HYMDI|nr:unnamed protein product [Hymenolepis diminuta]